MSNLSTTLSWFLNLIVVATVLQIFNPGGKDNNCIKNWLIAYAIAMDNI